MSDPYVEPESAEARCLLACAQQWARSLGLTGLLPASPPPASGMAAEVRIEGTPSWVLRVEATELTVRAAAGQLTKLESGAIEAELLRDMIREMTNTIAGNLYPALDGAKGLGLPQAEVSGGVEVARVGLSDGAGGAVWMQLRCLADKA